MADKKSKILNLSARPILDSRGEWTIEVTVELEGGIRSKASVPQGKSKGALEAKFVSPEEAVKNVEEKMAPALIGKDVSDQFGIDKALIKLDGKPDKSKLGANAILGVSMACARTSAASNEVPLWFYLRQLAGEGALKDVRPRLFVNVINGGLHAGNNLNFQEYIVIPKTDDLDESVRLSADFYSNLKEYLAENFAPSALNVGDEGGFACNFKDDMEPFRILKKLADGPKFFGKIDFGMDAAVSGRGLEKNYLLDFYKQALKETDLIYLEDPFSEDEFISFRELLEEFGEKMIIAGDDLTVTNVSIMKKAKKEKSVNGVIIKPNQIGTLTETLEAVKFARDSGWAVIVSHRSGETNDDFAADLAFGVGAEGFKLGAPARGERVAKYNRLLEIEKEMP